MPNYNATISLPELQQTVTVKWDDYGVPHIFAQNELDAFTTLGYAHAQDRLWQLTLSSMFIEGRFSEFLGSEMIEFDRFSRTIGFWRVAGEIEQKLDTRELQILQAYSNGINRFIQDNHNRLPVEFALTGINPQKWSPRHTIALTRALGWELNVSWWSKVMLGFLEPKLPEAALRELFPDWGTSHQVMVRRNNLIQIQEDFESTGNQHPETETPDKARAATSTLMDLLSTDLRLRATLGQQGSHIGSNAWVVDGTRSETGYPLLAGDPHLGLEMPGKWYEAHLNINGYSVSGATIPGAPLIVLGQTHRHAWSFTSLMPDDTDFFLEKINPLDRSQYLKSIQNDTLHIYGQFKTIREIIKTKEGDEILHETRITQNGPIISDIHPNKSLLGDELISMNWTGYHDSNEIRAILGMMFADSFQGFQQSLTTFGTPALNIVYADIDGNIGMFTSGLIPIRNSVPLLFKDGWDTFGQWNGFVGFDRLPKTINPAEGVIANANNQVGGANYPYYITAFWEPDSRIRRINELLGSQRLHNIQSFKEIQNDIYSTQAKDITEIIIPVLESSDDPLILKALPYLKNWDFKFSESATAASLFEGFFLKFVENIFKPYLGEVVYDSFIQLENFPVRVTTQLLNKPSIWLQTVSGDTNYRDSVIVVSMRQTVEELEHKFGSTTSEWRWENQHTLTLRPPLFAQAADAENASGTLRLIEKNILSKGPYPVPGHSMTVNNTQYSWKNPYAQVLGASIRRIVDLSDPGSSESVLPTGQSGNPLSDHFGDQTNLWLTGKYRIFQHNNQIIDMAQYRTMTLNP